MVSGTQARAKPVMLTNVLGEPVPSRNGVVVPCKYCADEITVTGYPYNKNEIAYHLLRKHGLYVREDGTVVATDKVVHE